MIPKEQFTAFEQDYIESQDFVQLVHDMDPTIMFVCHHNAYLVAGFLARRGHDCRWISGYYKCNPSTRLVHHSWVEVNVDGKPAVILEFDPRQLFIQGGYENDPMPSGEVPEFEIQITPIATIVDPELVELPDITNELFIVASQDVLSRYVQDRTSTPDIDLDRLDKLAQEAHPHYEEMLEDVDDSEGD